MTSLLPLRHPETRSAAVMGRRGWWLIVANLLLPGSAQLLAGNRRLGRIGVCATGLAYALLILALLISVVRHTALLGLFTHTGPLVVAQVALVAYCCLWVVLTLDTLRLVRLVRLAQTARIGVSVFAIVALVATVGVVGYGSVVVGSARNALGSIFQVAASQPPVDGRYNIMLLGGDSGPGRDGLRPDSMSVISIDAKTGKAVNIGLPREMDNIPFVKGSPMLKDYPDGYGAHGKCDVDACLLNSIYTEVQLYKPKYYPDAVKQGSEPGIEAMRDALEGATGLTIQYYVLIDMQGFSDLIDALGGVTVTVTEKLPIGGDENLNNVEGWIMPGRQHMSGWKAQWYARSRHNTSDYDRMQRQRQLENAILAQMNPENVVTKFQGIAKAGAQVVKTDIPQSMLSYFVQLAMKTKAQPVTSLELVPPLVPDPTNPNWTSIHSMVKRSIAGESPKPTAKATASK